MNRITILMSCFNCEETIDRAINSLFSQSYPNWILFLCDDGSSDNTKEKILQYSIKYPEKIKVFLNEKNEGLTYSLNKMIKDVKTEYIARMDSDDVSIYSRLEKQISFLDSNPEFSFCGSYIDKFDENGVYCTFKYIEKPQSKDFYWNSPYAHPTVMIKTKAILEVFGYRDIEKTVRCEDYDLWFRLYEKGYKGYNIQEPLLQYYEGRNSFNKRKFKYRINECKIRFEGFKRLNLYPLGIIYVVKPLIVGVIPGRILNKLKRNLT